MNAGRSKAAVVKCEKVQVGEERRWKLTDVIGEEDGLGIECLSGSGAIARSATCLSSVHFAHFVHFAHLAVQLLAADCLSVH